MKNRDGRQWRVSGATAFSGTTTSASVDAEGLKFIQSFSLSVSGATYDADDIPSLNLTRNADGSYTVPADGRVPIVRNSSGQSGREFSYVFWGY